MMRVAKVTLVLFLAGWAGTALADPDKDESGKGRERGTHTRSYDSGVPGLGPEESDFWGNDGYERSRREGRTQRDYEDDRGGYGRSRRAARAFQEEDDHGNCQVER